MKKIIVISCLLLMVCGLGCMAVSSLITPASLDSRSIKYAVDSGVADEKDYEGYPNLAKAERLVGDVDAAHSTVQLDLQQQADKDDLDYSINRDISVSNYQVAVKREEQLFGEQGLLSLGMSLLGVGGFGTVLGLFRKRPGDWSQTEVDTALAEVSGKTKEELTTKEHQFSQLIIGIQKFVNTLTPEMKQQFKVTMNQEQDTDTVVAVQTTKKGLGL